MSASLQQWFLSTLALGAPGENPDPILPGGGRILFAGHSFFVPVARDFNSVADNLYPTDTIPNHVSIDPVMSGGESGSPLNLWLDLKDRRAIVSALRQEPPPDVLALTVGNETVTEDYQLWLDVAKVYNPNISLLIGIPFGREGAITPTDEYAEMMKGWIPGAKDTAAQLRADNPDNEIYLLEYGTTSLVMKYMFDEGLLDEDVPDGILCAVGDCLFRDAIPGHPDKMMYQMATLVWLHLLYGMDPMAFDPPAWNDWYSAEAVYNITSVVINTNKVLKWN